MTTRVRIAMAGVLGIVLGATGMVDASHDPARASRGDQDLVVTFDRTYRRAAGQMKRESRAAGVRIDEEEILVGLSPDAHIVSAPVRGFETLVVPDDFSEGADVSFVFLHGIQDVPDGFYLVRLFVDPDGYARQDPDAAHVELIRDGTVIRGPVRIADDPNPERGPRQELTVGETTSAARYIRDKHGHWICIELVKE